ncbi:unnamed protein product [Acanthoscelides obtectus]|uniref:Uncharacterized protein n=1 Tax=Acanthoscelides obtectus TaxID=200917 RepID=A0A9P0QAC3_ACAOB|nr:unnamed protein product [Acanthoscelides obtectus]CAK1648141.1 hypothetical protein AOBTE_LOCUS15557 [Acanthoscelides obtectus]
MYVIVYLVLLISVGSLTAQNVTDILKGVATYKDCFNTKDPASCLKEKALAALNETIMDDRPIVVGFMEIQKNPNYFAEKNGTEVIPEEGSGRSILLSNALVDKIMEFVKSRTVRVNLNNAFEARKKGGGGGGGGGKGGGKGMMMVAAGMAAVAVNMMMGKMMVMAGSALMIAKIALLLSIIMIIKKMQEKGGGEEKHVVYADSGHGGGGGGGGGYGGGGGWHRSIDDPQNMVYKQWAQAASSTENGSGL